MNISENNYKTLTKCIMRQYMEVVGKIHNFNLYEVESYSQLSFRKEELEVMINILKDVKEDNEGGRMKKCIYLDAKNNEIEADFYGIFQESEVIRPEPFVGGHMGGVRAWQIAVVYTDEDGVHNIDPLNIKKIYEIEE